MRSRVLLVAALLGGCSHELDNPKPSVSGIMPKLACDAQLVSPITVSGMNFTPIPTRTLRKFEFLNIPEVTLSEAQTLDGTAMSGMPIMIADDVTQPDGLHTRWESEQMLSFDVYPALSLMPGVYDVTVTNPDGKKAPFPTSLAIVPPPMVTSVVPPNICDAQSDQTVTVNGANFLQLTDATGAATTPTVSLLDASGMAVLNAHSTASGCAAVATVVMQGISECSTLKFVVPKGSVPVGTYSLIVTNPAPAACISAEPGW
jgi:hypothetical protein